MYHPDIPGIARGKAVPSDEKFARQEYFHLPQPSSTRTIYGEMGAMPPVV